MKLCITTRIHKHSMKKINNKKKKKTFQYLTEFL